MLLAISAIAESARASRNNRAADEGAGQPKNQLTNTQLHLIQGSKFRKSEFHMSFQFTVLINRMYS